MINRVAAGLAAALFLAWGWGASASAVYCYARGMLPMLAFPYLQWVDAARWWDYTPETTLYVAASAVPPTIVVGLIVLALRLRRGGGRRGGSDLYGKTGWATATDMRRGGIGRSSRP